MINFNHDSWCGDPLAQTLNAPDFIIQTLLITVSSYIVNHQWNFPADITQA